MLWTHLDRRDRVLGQDDQQGGNDHDDEKKKNSPDLRNVGAPQIAIRKFLGEILSKDNA